MKAPAKSFPKRVRGFALLEALIAFLIFAFGVLGFVGLQISMVKAQTSAKFRGDAAVLAFQLIGTMRADTANNLANYSTANCPGRPQCNDWLNKVADALPSGAATVTVVNQTVTINILWTPPEEGQHTYTTVSAIQH